MTTWQGFFDAFKRLISSMKFWTFVLALLTTIGAKYGFKVDDQMFWTIVGLFGGLLGVQGLADHGKNAGTGSSSIAKLAQGQEISPLIGTVDTAYLKSFEPTAVKISTKAGTDSPTSHELMLSNGASVDITNALVGAGFVQAQTTMPVVVKPASQSGFAKLGLLFGLVGTAALGAGIVAFAMAFGACSTAKNVEDHVVTGAKAAYKCGKAELAAEIKQWTPVLADEVSRSIDQTTGKPDWTQLKPVLGELKSDAAGCALAAVVAAVLGTSTGTGAQPLAVDRAAVLAGFNAIRNAQFGGRDFELPDGSKI